MAKDTIVRCDDCGATTTPELNITHIYVDRGDVRKQVEWCDKCLVKNAPALAALHAPEKKKSE